MGHYDNIYDSIREEEEQERRLQIKEKFKKLTSKLDVDDKEFLNQIIENLEDYKVFFKVIKRHGYNKK